jgi:hypothetical protein
MDAAYSGTPLAKKLGYKSGQRALLVNAPPEYFDWLAGAPEGVAFSPPEGGEGGLDLIHIFSSSLAELAERIPAVLPSLAERGMLWVSWPKRAAAKKLGLAPGLSEDAIRDLILPLGLVDVKVCAVSEVWSGLKIVRRLKG